MRSCLWSPVVKGLCGASKACTVWVQGKHDPRPGSLLQQGSSTTGYLPLMVHLNRPFEAPPYSRATATVFLALTLYACKHFRTRRPRPSIWSKDEVQYR